MRRDFYERQLDEIGVYMNVVAVLEDLCLVFHGASSVIEHWSIPRYDLLLDLTCYLQPYRFGAWTVLRAVELAAMTEFKTMSRDAYWQGHMEGNIKFIYVNPRSAGVGRQVAENMTLTTDDPTPSSLQGFQARHELELVPSYNGVTMTKRAVLMPIIEIMVSADEEGPHTFCHVFSRPSFVLTPLRDAHNLPLLRWGQLTKMMRVLAKWVVWNRRYR